MDIIVSFVTSFNLQADPEEPAYLSFGVSLKQGVFFNGQLFALIVNSLRLFSRLIL